MDTLFAATLALIGGATFLTAITVGPTLCRRLRKGRKEGLHGQR